MRIIKRIFILTLLTFSFWSTYSQETDNLIVYPNPFHISSNIHFDTVKKDTISLRLINSFGKIIQTYIQSEILPIGSYEINLLGDSLANGIYFIILDIGTSKNLSIKALKIGSTTGVSDNSLKKSFLIFPNPTDDYLTIPIESIKKIIITNLTGQILKSFTTEQKTISIIDLAAGQYLINILTDKGEILTTQKIVKLE